jgi:integrase
VNTDSKPHRYSKRGDVVATKYGWKELGWLARNPVLDVSKGAESAGVVRYLSDEERDALLAAAAADDDPNIHTAIVLALATGLRASNLRALAWADVDLKRKSLRIGDSKNGEGRWVPLIGPAVDALKAQHKADPTQEGWVFKSTTKDTPADINGAAWMRVKRAAGLTGAANFRFHDLRHTAGTYLNEAGASAIQIAAALGHKTLAMAKRYSHQSPEFTRSVFDKLEGRMGKKPADE